MEKTIITDELLQSIVTDIFEKTGQAIPKDDPIVLAALVQSKITENLLNQQEAAHKNFINRFEEANKQLTETEQKMTLFANAVKQSVILSQKGNSTSNNIQPIQFNKIEQQLKDNLKMNKYFLSILLALNILLLVVLFIK